MQQIKIFSSKASLSDSDVDRNLQILETAVNDWIKKTRDQFLSHNIQVAQSADSTTVFTTIVVVSELMHAK